ncbi:signal peptidase I [Flavonifractor plautii]|uniref:signal peptidase I n=1 Tax=Flavonifractor plautii TaxID=292800 RepID=UPI001958C0D2|nr:signal peptidase I [Flavonifractor plautii]MBM6663457.1 signal peptidase I [Flavonifractor plautii]
MRHDAECARGSGGPSLAATGVGLALCVILSFFLVCNLTVIVKGALFPDRPPSVLGVTPMVVLSGSMSGEQEGHIEVGDLIFVRRADPAALEVGDVIAYMSGGTTVTHRITAIDTGDDGGLLFTTKGDANDTEDTSPVTEEQLVGLCFWRIPKVGTLPCFCRLPWVCCCLWGRRCWPSSSMTSCAGSAGPPARAAGRRNWRPSWSC